MDKIDINAASEEQLVQLQGIGPALARRIVEYRNTNGPFAGIEDLGKVKGIHPPVLAVIRDRITVGLAESKTTPVQEAATTPAEHPPVEIANRAREHEVLVEAGLAPPPEFIEKDVPPQAVEWPPVYSQAEERPSPAGFALRDLDLTTLAAGIGLVALAGVLVFATWRFSQRS